ncbi:MAG: FAD-dependent oxidoreductase [Elainellaceae cyanobacterium]
MTVSPDNKPPQLAQTAVVGASIAGLLTARVLSEFSGQVVLVDRDRLPQESAPRRGVPQSVQPHVLLTRGYRILEALFPNIGKDLAAAGAIPIDWGRDFRYYHQGGWNATCAEASDLRSYTCTRYLLEAVIRSRVAQLPNVQWIEEARVCGLTGNGGQVTGVRYRPSGQKQSACLQADLVIDASGRGSNATQWLEELSAPVPEATVVNANLGYATQRLRLPQDWPGHCKVMLVSQRAPDNPRLGYLAQVEGGEWIATLGGYSKVFPPLEQGTFLDFAAHLEDAAFYEAIKAAQPVSDIKAHRATANRLYHYERLPMPAGFAVIGDAVCALCPVYGQGMTVSALSALVLRDWLSRAKQPLATSHFQQKLAKAIQFPWGVAAGSDSKFLASQGAAPTNPAAALLQKYMARLIHKSKQEDWVNIRFTEVAHMVKPPAALFAPRLVWKALRP